MSTLPITWCRRVSWGEPTVLLVFLHNRSNRWKTMNCWPLEWDCDFTRFAGIPLTIIHCHWDVKQFGFSSGITLIVGRYPLITFSTDFQCEWDYSVASYWSLRLYPFIQGLSHSTSFLKSKIGNNDSDADEEFYFLDYDTKAFSRLTSWDFYQMSWPLWYDHQLKFFSR